MRRPELIARQSGCPSGLLGRLIGSIMATETAAANDATIAALALQPTDRVLEIGFGHGRTLDRVARQLTAGFVAGIDLSETMVRMTARRCRDLMTAGRVTLHKGDSIRMPFPAGHFNKAYSVHTLYFWSHPEEHLREIHRVLCSGSHLALGFHTDEAPGARDFPETVYRFYTQAEVSMLLQSAGFSEVVLSQPAMHRGFVIASATRSSRGQGVKPEPARPLAHR
jgi:SAM-dependent methyltransferase